MTFPVEAETLVGSTCNRLFLSDWQHFNELDPELESSCFPAWMVLKKPALAKNAFTLDCESVANVSLQLMCSLVGCKKNDVNETIIKLRGRLQQQNPLLFVHYMVANP